MDALHGVTIVCWLMGTAPATPTSPLHDGRLRMLWEKLVDTPVRGVVYEGGPLAPAVLAAAAPSPRPRTRPGRSRSRSSPAIPPTTTLARRGARRGRPLLGG